MKKQNGPWQIGGENATPPCCARCGGCAVAGGCGPSGLSYRAAALPH